MRVTGFEGLRVLEFESFFNKKLQYHFEGGRIFYFHETKKALHMVKPFLF